MEEQRRSGAAGFLLGGAQQLLRGAQQLGGQALEDAQHLLGANAAQPGQRGSEKRNSTMLSSMTGFNSMHASDKGKSMLDARRPTLENRGGHGLHRDLVVVDTGKDQGRAAFLEECFAEYAGKKRVDSARAPKDQLQNNMFDEFLGEADLKCGNLRQVYKLIQVMRRNKLAEEAEEAEGLDGIGEEPKSPEAADQSSPPSEAARRRTTTSSASAALSEEPGKHRNRRNTTRKERRHRHSSTASGRERESKDSGGAGNEAAIKEEAEE